MIDQELVKKYFVGKDGFVWWVGQIAPENKWSPNIPGRRVSTTDDIKGFGDRYKVRILGYHDISDETPLNDDDLPWAQVMLPVTAGAGGGAASQSVSLHQGTYVFGFFLDGEDAQQPVILGILGYNQYTLVDKNPKANGAATQFIPFDGKYGVGSDDKVPTQNIRENPQASPTATGELAVPAPAVEAPKPKASGLIITTAQSESLTDIASKEQKQDGEKSSSLPVPQRCDKSGGQTGIVVEITNTMQKIQELTAKATSWAAAVNGKIDNIQEQIDNLVALVSKKIAEFIKWIINEVRSFAIEKIQNTAKDLYYLTFPNQRQKIKEAQTKVCDGISCLIDKIIDSLLSLITNAISGLIGKFLQVTECFMENLLGNLLGNVLGGLLSGIKGILDGIQGALGAIGDVGNLINSVVGFIKDLLSFGAAFSCQEDPSCPEVEEWSIWKGVENASSIFGDLGGLGGLADKVTGIAQQAVGIGDNIMASANGIVDGAKSIGNSIAGAGSAISGAVKDSFNSCYVGPIKCGPPTINIVGGGGVGAAANAIVNDLGQIVGVDLISPGYGYKSEPTVFAKDPCGKGKGSKLKAKIKKKPKTKDTVGIVTAGGELYPKNNKGPKTPNTGTGSTTGTGTTPTPGTGTGSTTGGTTGIGTGGIVSVPGTGGTQITPITVGGLLPKVTLSANPFPVGSGGSSVTLSWKTENATGIVTSNFPTNNLLKGDYTIEEYTKNKTFNITVENSVGQVTAALFVPISGGNSGGGDNEIDSIIVIDPGTDYLQEPDGSLGAFDKPWADPNNGDTIIQDPDGNYSVITPGTQIILPKDSIITPANSVSGFTTFVDGQDPDLDVGGEFLVLFPPGIPTKVPEDVLITAPQPMEKDKTALTREEASIGNLGFSNGQYGVVIYLCGIEVIDGGINYDSIVDDIELNPRNGSLLKMKTGAFGKIESVEILDAGMGFRQFPEVIINSETGFNASITPIFCVKRVGEGDPFDLTIEQLDNNQPVINVIDCTGKFNYKASPPNPNDLDSSYYK